MSLFVQDFHFATFWKRVNSFAAGYRQNIALLADEKEEIANLLDDYFSSKKVSQLIHIHIDPTYLSKKDMLKSLALSLLSEYSTVSAGLDQLISICSEPLPKTTGLIKTFLQADFDFSNLTELINKFIEESGRNCVFILEEFLLADKLFKNFYKQFSNFAISQRKCMLVVSSSSVSAADKALGNELNFLFGNFEKIYLNKKSFFDNFLFLKNQLKSLKPSPVFLAFFVNITGGKRSYCQAFIEAIKELYAGSEEEITIKVLEKLLLRRETYFFQKFSSKITQLTYHFNSSDILIKLLFFLSKGYMRKTRLQEISGLSSADITSRLNKLATLNYISKHGNIYKIKDELFAFWLAHVFKFYSIAPVFEAKKRKQLWEKEMQEEISIFKEEFLKNRLKKVLELFMAFQDDFLPIGKDKYPLPRLNKVKIISYPEKNFHLLVGEGKKIIFAAIKEKTADDKDVFDFIKKGSSVKGKNVQKIFISLDELTDAAKLLAKNKKISIWDRDRVNRLLNIYNKPNFLQDLENENLSVV